MLWTDVATWSGPVHARNLNAMAQPPYGLVLHIASGFYEGTIAWQRRPSGPNMTSSHFIIGRDGACVQMLDTVDGSWAQINGNNTWLSVELEGFAPEDPLHSQHPGWETATPAQVETVARLLAKAHQVYGIPLQVASSPTGRGLGHHSMGAECGVNWGHAGCPGTAIKSQKAAIVARAVQLTNPSGGSDMDYNQAQKLDAIFNLYPTVKLDTDGVPDGTGALLPFPVPITKALAAQAADIASIKATQAQILTLLQAGTPGGTVTISQADVVAALESPAGQAALVKADNTAEDS